MTSSASYPVDAIVPDLLRAFDKSNIVALSAPPGAGKTTRIPIALLNSEILTNGKILMLEPRRLAARRSAEFMSSQLSEVPGTTVGYRIRGENRVGPTTRIEIVTEGILTRMLQRAPDVPEVGIIIFDEFHERSIHADLGLALSLDVQKHLRQDLRILIMSATLDMNRLSAMLGHIPLLESKGRLFPVETRYARFAGDKPIEVRIADTVLRSLDNDEGDILVFLPGWREIQRTERALGERRVPEDVVVHILHGEASFAAQTAALTPSPDGKRKVILSTNVAETSLTIEGVRIVVDSGLVRVAQFDPHRGMSGLVTIPVSKASADQRRGRAGRVAPGVCYRLWTEAEHVRLIEFAPPEIKSADLAPLALDFAQWGTPNSENLLFLDPPPPAHLQQGQRLLHDLGAVDKAGRMTPEGKAMADLPIHPRLARMIVRAQAMNLGATACTLAALLEERDLFSGKKDADVDLAARWHDLQRGRSTAHDRVVAQARRLRQMTGIREDTEQDSSLGLLLAFAYPDRIAQRREQGGNAYLLASGPTAILPSGSLMSRNEYLVVADADGIGATVRIFLCARISKQELETHFVDSIVTEDEVQWNATTATVESRRARKLGAILLAERPLSGTDERIADAMISGIRQMGLEALPWDDEARSIRERSEWIRAHDLVASDWPNLSDQMLTDSLEQWIKPFLTGIRQRTHLSKLNLVSILTSMFTYRQFQELDQLAPTHLRLPSGTHAKIDYTSGSQPVLAVRLQELFGQVETPRVGNKSIAVLIHLLSPARRPLAVTQDLPSFWTNVYPDIRNQLRAKYPKHVWPEDPLRATPTNKTKRQLSGRK
jgi:ATP-dependent helicase HrpB